jgi:hypothetical protein
MTDPTPSCSAAYATSNSGWATGRRTSPPAACSPTPVNPPPLRRCLRHAAIHPPQQPPATATPPPKRVCFTLAPTPLPSAADSGTVIPGTPARFFEGPEEAPSSRYPQGNCGQPAWQRDYIFFAAYKTSFPFLGFPPWIKSWGCM